DLEKLITVAAPSTLAALPANHEIRSHLRQEASARCRSLLRTLLFCQKVMQLLFKGDSPLSREVYVVLLERLCELSKRVAKEVKEWLLYHDDERKYDIEVTVTIIRARILSVPELDVQLARMIESGRTSAIDFAANLASRCLLQEPPVASQNDFFSSLQILKKMVQRGKASESAVTLLDTLRNQVPAISLKELTAKDGEPAGLRDQLATLFTDWVRMYHHPASNEKTHAAYITKLQQQGILKAEAISPLFFRVCTEISVDTYIKTKAAPGLPPNLPFQAVDAFARLIVLLVRYHTDPAGVDPNHARLNLTAKILSIIVLVLVHSHEQRRVHFNQRPFFRLFSTLLNDLHLAEEHLQPIYIQILSAVSNTFHTLQPSFLPGFTFSWLQLMSHRFFMPKLLLAENQKVNHAGDFSSGVACIAVVSEC
ncbi:hypothetical protein BDK51DRAFT_15960, partial [Blyttiomyces helicus]